MGKEPHWYPDKHRDWRCPGRACGFTMRMLPTHYAPGHRCHPDRPSTHHYLVPDEEGDTTS